MRADAETTVPLEGPLDLARTLGPWRTGFGDASCTLEPGRVVKAARTRGGPACLLLEQEDDRVIARAWGPGAAELIERAAAFVGEEPPPLATKNALLRRADKAHRGLRTGAGPSVFDALVRVVLQQRVRTRDALQSFGELIRRYGEPAPGPLQMMLPPSPQALAKIPYEHFHVHGVERSRAEIVRHAATRHRRIEALADVPLPDAKRALGSLPGIGVWSVAMIAAKALGDADAVPVGDYHLKNDVAFVLAREPRADDARMLELLEPYRGQRWRVIRLVHLSGVSAPAYGPKMSAPHWYRHRR